MSLAEKFFHLARRSKKDWPRWIENKVRRTVAGKAERLLYSYEDTPKQANNAQSTPINLIELIHPDVLTPGFSELFFENFPEEAATITGRADQIVHNKIEILGSGLVDLAEYRNRMDLEWVKGDPESKKSARAHGRIPWHFDIGSHWGWNPETFYRDIEPGSGEGAEIKRAWDLSRGHHLVLLGQAYRLTQDEKYARTFFNQVDDWIEQNPPKFGVNWANPMEIAIRAANWILAYALFRGSPSKPNQFDARLRTSLVAHGNHLYLHREWAGELSTNHYLANLMGLFYIGSAVNHEKWKTFSLNELKNQILSQTYDDGFFYESSTAYHRLSTEICLFMLVVAGRQIQDSEGSFAAIIKKIVGENAFHRFVDMFHKLSHLSDAKGHFPLIGDNDSGRSHTFFQRPDNDAGPILNWGTLLFKHPEFKPPKSSITSEIVWLFGFSGLTSLKSLPVHVPEPFQKIQTACGLDILKGENFNLIFSRQPNGVHGIGSHTHNDKLSFTLSIDGEPIFIDPGTLVYSSNPTARNLFRSTKMHNTVEVDGAEQNRFIHMFMLHNDTHCFQVDENPNELRARHTGYQRLDGNVIHERRISIQRDPFQVQISDAVLGKGQHFLRLNLTLAPGITATQTSNTQITIQAKNLKFNLESATQDLKLFIMEGIFAPAYGEQQSCQQIQFSGAVQLPFKNSLQIKII